jgi:hypothetical protein
MKHDKNSKYGKDCKDCKEDKKEDKKLKKESFDSLVNSLLQKYIFGEEVGGENLETNPSKIVQDIKKKKEEEAKKPVGPKDLKKAQITAKANADLKKLG